jgi:hypothetical protein
VLKKKKSVLSHNEMSIKYHHCNETTTKNHILSENKQFQYNHLEFHKGTKGFR